MILYVYAVAEATKAFQGSDVGKKTYHFGETSDGPRKKITLLQWILHRRLKIARPSEC